MNKTIAITSVSADIGSMNIHGELGITAGLKKTFNEDRIGVLSYNNKLRGCICDGHWGDQAAQMTYDFFLSEYQDFPVTQEQAIRTTKELEVSIFNTCGNLDLNGVTDTTPETSFVAFEISEERIRMVMGGDCRFLILSKTGSCFFRGPSLASWIGSFSYLGLRNRVPVEQGTYFFDLPISEGDTVLFFSDGIDECIYEKSTISVEHLCVLAQSHENIRQNIDQIFEEVFSF